MQCEVCKENEATIHLTEINNGARTEMHVCEYCAQQEGLTIKSNIPLNELLGNLFASQPSDEELLAGKSEQLSCPHCGFTLEQFRKEAVLGCPNDYEVFEKSLAPLIQKAHDGKCLHCGKVPTKVPADTKNQIKISNLQQKLDQAVRKENYELAAKVRDEIDRVLQEVNRFLKTESE